MVADKNLQNVSARVTPSERSSQSLPEPVKQGDSNTANDFTNESHPQVSKTHHHLQPPGTRVDGESGNTDEDVNDKDDEDEEECLEDICEVVLSFKCRHCSFLCEDKKVLTLHVRSCSGSSRCVTKGLDQKAIFFGKGSDLSEDYANGSNTILDLKSEIKGRKVTDGDVVGKVELSPIPSVPPTPDPPIFEEYSPSGEEGIGERHGTDDVVEDVFLCAECDIVFPSKELCCSHMHQIHDLTQFSADFIQDEIISKKPTEETLPAKRKVRPPKHLTAEEGTIVPKRYRVTKDIFFTCSKCPAKFESNEVMKLHEQCHPKISDVDEESTEYETYSNPGLGFVCPVCESKDASPAPVVFAKWGNCAGHLWREHKIDCELYTCPICKQFKSPLVGKVKDHQRIHAKQAHFICNICNKGFKQMKQLRCHEKYHKENKTKLPPKIDSRWYTPKECHICKRILSDAKCLKKHIFAVHKKLKPYSCNICGHETARKAELQLHVRQHTGEKPYKCTICQFATGDHNSLRKHKLRHGDQRPYACPYCDYRCIQSCAFKKHIIAVHPGQEVVFLCQLCSHASVNEVLFSAHQKDHAEGRLPSSEARNSSVTNGNHEDIIDGNSEPDNQDSTSPTTKEPDNLSKSSWVEDDSVDIVDTGGVTIPASPCQSAVAENSNTRIPNSEAVKPSDEHPKESEKPAHLTYPLIENFLSSPELLNG